MELIKNHYGWSSAIIAGLSSLAGIINLAVYTNYIGRPDVFMASLELGPGLIVLWLSCVLFFVMVVGSMLGASIFFSLTLTELKPRQEYAKHIVRALASIVAISMLTMLLPIVITAYNGETASLWWLLAIFLAPALCSNFFLRKNIGKITLLADDVKFRTMFFICVAFTLSLGLTALFGIYPAWLVTNLYHGNGETEGWGVALIFCFLAMLASLAPAIGYHHFSPEGRAARVKGGLFGLALFLALLTLMVPSFFSIPAMGAVKFLGISDRHVNRYLISTDDYRADSLDKTKWSISRDQDRDFILHGFPLYTYGSIALLCPADLIKIKIKDLDQHTGQCVPFAKTAIKQLDRIE